MKLKSTISLLLFLIIFPSCSDAGKENVNENNKSTAVKEEKKTAVSKKMKAAFSTRLLDKKITQISGVRKFDSDEDPYLGSFFKKDDQYNYYIFNTPNKDFKANVITVAKANNKIIAVEGVYYHSDLNRYNAQQIGQKCGQLYESYKIHIEKKYGKMQEQESGRLMRATLSNDGLGFLTFLSFTERVAVVLISYHSVPLDDLR